MQPLDSVAIQCRGVSVDFDGSFSLRSIDLSIKCGEILSLIGPSGCGKTTLLRAIAGLQTPSAGDVTLHNAAHRAGGRIGFVFQQPALLPWASTLENVMLPLDLLKIGTVVERKNAAMETLRAVRLGDHVHKRPCELSGGMQMRASIARALVTEPEILLLDEPFAALDDMLRAELGELLMQLWENRGFTAVLVTHNIGESVWMSHRIAILNDGTLSEIIENPLPFPRRWSLMREARFGEFFGRVSDRLRGTSTTVGNHPAETAS